MCHLNLLNPIYKIDCKDCDASYVGQTSRCLKTRISKHRNHINRNTIQYSVITQHRMDLFYEFNWDNVHILDAKSKFYIKDCYQRWYILKNKNKTWIYKTIYFLLIRYILIYFQRRDASNLYCSYFFIYYLLFLFIVFVSTCSVVHCFSQFLFYINFMTKQLCRV